jgi:hypothetical protein
MRSAIPLAVACAVLVLFEPPGHGATEQPFPPGRVKLVDMTFACSVTRFVAGYPDRFVSQHVTVGMHPQTSTDPGGASVRDKTSKGSLVGVLRGPVPGQPSGSVSVNDKQCTWMPRARIPLSGRGLPAPAVRFNKAFDCRVARILVRVRAVLRRPAPWRRTNDGLLAVRGRVDDARIAVRTLRARKPIAFASVDAKGGALYVSRRSPRCTPTF